MSTGEILKFGERKNLIQKTEEERAAEKLAAEAAQKAKLEAEYEKFKAESATEFQKEMLQTLDDFRKLIMDGVLQDFIILGRSNQRDLMTDFMAINMQLAIPPVFYAYMGKMSELQVALTDMASTGPHMDTQGQFYTIPLYQNDEAEMDE